jgi:hypothetical protein
MGCCWRVRDLVDVKKVLSTITKYSVRPCWRERRARALARGSNKGFALHGHK